MTIKRDILLNKLIKASEQETFSLRHIGDNFRKVVVTGDPYEKP